MQQPIAERHDNVFGKDTEMDKELQEPYPKAVIASRPL